MKTDLIETKHVDTEKYEWIAFIPGKEALAQGGDTEAEAIGRLWLASAGDMIAIFIELMNMRGFEFKVMSSRKEGEK